MLQASQRRRALRLSLSLLTCAGLIACDLAQPPAPEPGPEPGVLEATRNGPEGAPPRPCTKARD